ncbi:hypothetical protein BBO99_00007593 [Phytophthora kernoviae]|uniref:Uncharacterized protein n=1 Tax=Phytophthora kernoviae TaxID=325452 RepID=A0A3R7GV93_9STRA|nr:hypothetical protein BBI17_008452 [Phytophthora kernoviae]RLN76384.1 hypothetical protein BBO99_00007593 [Phytophthora kernoviae]
MGAAGSIESTPYDEGKFLQSKNVMESGADDADKFAKLKSIWAEGGVASEHTKSAKELPPADHGAEAPKEDGHHHKEDGHHKEGDHCHKEDGHTHKEGEHHHKEDGHTHKEGEHHHKEDGHAHNENGHTHKEDGHHHQEDGHAHKEDGHHHKEDGHHHKEDGHAHKEDGHATEAPKEELRAVPTASASTGQLPAAESEHHSEKQTKEIAALM